MPAFFRDRPRQRATGKSWSRVPEKRGVLRLSGFYCEVRIKNTHASIAIHKQLEVVREHITADDEFHDFGRAAINPRDARIAIEA